MKIHDFNDCLARSHRHADAPWWAEVYERAFPGCELQDLRSDGWWQRAGIDRRVHLANATTVSVDEKVREEDYPDILIEAFSKWYGPGNTRNKPGWIEYAACDYLAYAFIPSRRCYLLPMRELQRVWQRNRREWWRRANDHDDKAFHRIQSVNPTYVTLSVAVSTPVLLGAIRDSLIVQWTTATAS